MSDIVIRRDDPAVQIMCASARRERIDSAQTDKLNDQLTAIAEDPNPMNMHALAQLVGFTVNELARPMSDFLTRLADYKNLGENDTAKFVVDLEGIQAYVQAAGATTPRSRIAHKTMVLDSVWVSARPFMTMTDIRRGVVNMADLCVRAALEMENAKLGYVRQVLEANYGVVNTVTGSAPFYAEGSGVLKTGLDPLVRHWQRYGGVGIVGDIVTTSQLAELTGFTAVANPATKQFADNIIVEQNQNGYIGRYLGAEVATMINPYKQGSISDTVLNPKIMFIFPVGASADMRPLKAFTKGPVQSMEATHIDDKTWEIRMDQEFGAGFAYGEQPYMSVYKDISN